MKKVSDRPNCCEKGNELIGWHTDCLSSISQNYFTGWGICTGYFIEDYEYEQIGYCPFCGRKPNSKGEKE